VLVQDIWPDLATRDLVMRAYLGSAERDSYERQPPRGRRGWLLGRLAVKDAVRHLLWANGVDAVWPAEIGVVNDERGKPYVTGRHGRALPRLEVSISHCAEVAVAFASTTAGPSRGGGVGIDVEEVRPRPPETVEFALNRTERELLTNCVRAGGDPEVWFTRFWTAKEAVAKARGTGLAGRPRDFVVVAAGEHEVRVAVTDATSAGHLLYRVDVGPISNRPGLPPRTYIVALAAQAPTCAETEPNTQYDRERTPAA
jgi:phosphopantetheinyl transferase